MKYERINKFILSYIYMVYSQIWLNHHMDNHHFHYITKFIEKIHHFVISNFGTWKIYLFLFFFLQSCLIWCSKIFVAGWFQFCHLENLLVPVVLTSKWVSYDLLNFVACWFQFWILCFTCPTIFLASKFLFSNFDMICQICSMGCSNFVTL